MDLDYPNYPVVKTAEMYAEILRSLGFSLQMILPYAEGRLGGIFRLFDTEDSHTEPVLTCIIGIVPPEKVKEKLQFSLEKGLRLLSRPLDIASSQSRDLEKKMYGGAIRVSNKILSFSGLPEQADEAMMIDIAFRARLFPGRMKEATAFAEQTGNSLFEKVYNPRVPTPLRRGN